jgi:hypothetical protein
MRIFYFFLNVSDFNDRNIMITENLLHQWYPFNRLVKKTFNKFYSRVEKENWRYGKKNILFSVKARVNFYIEKEIYHLPC